MGVNLVTLLVPIVSVVSGVLMIVAIVVSKHRRDLREIEMRHRERMAAIEKGFDLPGESSGYPRSEYPESPPEAGRTRTRTGSRYLLRGLVWLGVGLAIAIPDTEPHKIQTFGWIAVAVGAAYLIYYLLEGRQEPPPPADRQPPQGNQR